MPVLPGHRHTRAAATRTPWHPDPSIRFIHGFKCLGANIGEDA